MDECYVVLLHVVNADHQGSCGLSGGRGKELMGVFEVIEAGKAFAYSSQTSFHSQISKVAGTGASIKYPAQGMAICS